MPNVRPLNKEKYGISKNRFQELRYRCYQYDEWKKELNYSKDTVKAIEYGKEGKGSAPLGSATENLAIRRVELDQKCKIIEQTALEASGDLYKFVLEGVTNEEANYNYLHMIKGLPSEKKNEYYDARRMFYWLLDKKRWIY